MRFSRGIVSVSPVVRVLPLQSQSPQPRALIVVGREEQTDEPVVQAARDLLAVEGYAVAICPLQNWLRSGASIAPEGAALVIAAGGDGSVREAAAMAQTLNAVLAILPLGTANDLARTLGLPLEADQALELLRSGRRRRIDLGRCNGRVFCNVASLGLSAEVAQRLTRERKKRWGPLAYVREVLDAFRTYRGLGVRLEIDGRRLVFRALQVGVASGESQGGGAKVSPRARIDDGRLRIYVLERQSLPRLLLMALSLKVGAHDLWEGAHFFTARKVRIETRQGQRINVDGDLLERTPADFDILPAALEVLVPVEERNGLGRELMTEEGRGNLLRSDAEVALGDALDALSQAAEVHGRGAERLGDSAAGPTLRALAERRAADLESLVIASRQSEEDASEPDPDRIAVARVIDDLRETLMPSAAESTLQASREAEDRLAETLVAARRFDQADAVAAQLDRLAEEQEELRSSLDFSAEAADREF